MRDVAGLGRVGLIGRSFAVLFLLASAAEAAQKRAVQAPAFDISPDAELPVPPIPPDDVPAYSAAPVPDSGIAGYVDPGESDGKTTKVTPGFGFYHPKDYNIGEGYLNGSTVAGEQERKAQPLPRLQLKVPLQ